MLFRSPVEAAAEEAFDGERHQLVEDGDAPPAGARVAETLAAGYTFQGRLLRRTLVRVQAESVSVPPGAAAQAGQDELGLAVEAEDETPAGLS